MFCSLGGKVPVALTLRVDHAVAAYKRLTAKGGARLYVSGGDVARQGKAEKGNTMQDNHQETRPDKIIHKGHQCLGVPHPFFNFPGCSPHSRPEAFPDSGVW